MVLKSKLKHNKKVLYPWDKETLKFIRTLNSPRKIQDVLDDYSYNTDDVTRLPQQVVDARRAHCFDGAVFAASVLAAHDEPPLILDMCAVRDDDHVIALFKRGKLWGAIAKSNYSGLRFREAIFRNPRELVLSYFENYYNLRGEKTLRSYSSPVNLFHITSLSWESEDPFEQIATVLVKQKHYPILPPAFIKNLSRVDSRMYAAGVVKRRS